jgi:uncharacterized membrane protein
MNDQRNNEQLLAVKRLAGTVYLCQILMFGFLGLPLLVGIAINLLNRNKAKGTWLESHFNWQIKNAWVALAGFALVGLTLEMGFALYILLPLITWLVYRIVVGWYALNDDRAL